MANGTEAARRTRSCPSLLTVFLLVMSSASSLSAMAASASHTQAAQSNDLTEAKQLNDEVVGLYQAGKYDEAISLAERALAIREKALGPDHPYVASSLNNLASLYDTKGDYAKAVAFQLRATDISERNIDLNLAAGSERQKLF